MPVSLPAGATSPRSRRQVAALGTLLLLLPALSGCADAPSTLDPRGPAAARIADLWWIMLALAAAVCVMVAAPLLYATARAWRGRPGGLDSPLGGNLLIAVGGVIVPAIILVVLVVLTALTGRALSPPATPDALAIEVTGHQFWWEVRYPGRQVETANQIHIPVGQPVRLELTSVDVIHSLWVPQLQGKLDLNPGKTNTLWLQADEPGVYQGLCAEFCGSQHANMYVLVVAEPPEQFAAWLDRQSQPAAQPATPPAQRGQQVFLAAGCAECHTIRGVHTLAIGTVGPDLTHFGSRQTLAAMPRANTRENLAIWLLDPQRLKPGSWMPGTPLSPEDLDALVVYLESLR